MKTILTFTRPNTSVAFFSTTVIPDSAKKGELLIFLQEAETKAIMDVSDRFSANYLTLVRTIEWKSPKDNADFVAEFSERFEWFHEARAQYVQENDMTLTIEVIRDGAPEPEDAEGTDGDEATV